MNVLDPLASNINGSPTRETMLLPFIEWGYFARGDIPPTGKHLVV
jgi:hypothetical protein